jgi:ubiquinone/menaquinone biosynthesis C-methylase UbiE
MSMFILMKILESSPHRYDRGVRLLARGRLDEVYDRIASHVKKGDKVLDIGCGTGALSLRAARKGAWVKGIDINLRMLEIARTKAESGNLSPNVEFEEMGVAELAKEDPKSYDVVTSGLCFSELSEEELTHTLRETRRILKNGGLLLVADEVRPERFLRRILQGTVRAVLKAVVFLFFSTTTRPLKNFSEKLRESRFQVESLVLNKSKNFMELTARKRSAGRV